MSQVLQALRFQLSGRGGGKEGCPRRRNGWGRDRESRPYMAGYLEPQAGLETDSSVAGREVEMVGGLYECQSQESTVEFGRHWASSPVSN